VKITLKKIKVRDLVEDYFNDPETSNFFKYFVRGIHNLKLKKVIATLI